MSERRRHVIQLFLLALAAGLALAAAKPARATDYAIAKIALEGEIAPGTGGALHANGFFSVALNDVGGIAYINDLTGGVPTWGVFVHDTAGNRAVSLSGDAAPGTGGGSYFLPGGFPTLNVAGSVSFAAAVSGGTAASGIFIDTGTGADLPVVVSGEAAPGTGGASFDGALNSLNRHVLNASATVAFHDTLSGGTAASGVFLYEGGTHSPVAVAGESAPGSGGGVYDGFGAPGLSDVGDVVFPAFVAGGSVTGGLFIDSAGVDSDLVLVGDPAPGTGGGTFADFLFPLVNTSGVVVFLSDVTGSSATGGIFRVAGGVTSAVILENDTAPGTGGGSYATVTSLAALNDAGDVAFSATVTGGAVEAGVFRFVAATGQVTPVVLFGDGAPDSGGASFAQFGLVDLNDAGQVALQATLSDGNSGLFLASPSVPVPALPTLALLVLGAALLGAARRVAD